MHAMHSRTSCHCFSLSPSIGGRRANYRSAFGARRTNYVGCRANNNDDDDDNNRRVFARSKPPAEIEFACELCLQLYVVLWRLRWASCQTTTTTTTSRLAANKPNCINKIPIIIIQRTKRKQERRFFFFTISMSLSKWSAAAAVTLVVVHFRCPHTHTHA